LDGDNQNYFQKERPCFPATISGIDYTFDLAIKSDEPSAISTLLPIQKPTENSFVNRPDYFPSYESLTPMQRYEYITCLSNPYNVCDIGYIFILYYGLERHLMYGDFERAFDVILKLRDVHSNRSFQHYSCSALIATAIIRNRHNLLTKLLWSMDKQYEDEMGIDSFLLMKLAFNENIEPKYLMKYATAFGFLNRRYIKGDSDLFLDQLTMYLVEQYGAASLPIELLDIKELPRDEKDVFANISFSVRSIPMPAFLECEQFTSAWTNVLNEAHERVKRYKRENKNSKSASED
jgi:hypothetical protein